MLAEEDAQCPGGCGQPLAESTDKANFRAYRIDSIVCHACAELQRAADIERDNKQRTYGQLTGLVNIKEDEEVGGG